MQLVEQHIISKADSCYEAIDAAAFASKNLYNLANYHMRQAFCLPPSSRHRIRSSSHMRKKGISHELYEPGYPRWAASPDLAT
jgi:hypothetical protein